MAGTISAAGRASGTPTAGVPTSPKLEIQTSRQFTAWLAEQRLSVALTTYQATGSMM
jgi:hypothetical protein